MERIENLRKRASTENEILLIDILLEAQEINDTVQKSSDVLTENSNNFNKAKDLYIETLNNFTEDKKNEMLQFFNFQVTQLIMAQKDLEKTLKELKELNISDSKPKERKKFLGLF